MQLTLPEELVVTDLGVSHGVILDPALPCLFVRWQKAGTAVAPLILLRQEPL